jgi:hypothetical protein
VTLRTPHLRTKGKRENEGEQVFDEEKDDDQDEELSSDDYDVHLQRESERKRERKRFAPAVSLCAVIG